MSEAQSDHGSDKAEHLTKMKNLLWGMSSVKADVCIPDSLCDIDESDTCNGRIRVRILLRL